MITIGQLARYVGVSTKTIRVYHDKGLLPEPDRDTSGYRRYGAADAIELIKIRTLAEAGVPLARIRDLRAATDEDLQQALDEIDDELTARIRGLRATQGRLRRLAAGELSSLPTEVAGFLERLARWGFTPRWVDLQRDLWILVFAAHPDQAMTLFEDQNEILSDPARRQLFLDYDHAHDLDADDPRLDDLARRIVEATRARYGTDELPELDTASEIPALIQGTVNAESAAWRHLDTLIRTRLNV
ncbi:MerR family transcriptional regulator [Streptomyces sp. NPDC092046]|uniref:MerR family transcriptional regulator n=1 Tax=Streptomyces sp. NPDC092046 TaxID=3366009 RepID=UPI003824FE7B